MQTDDLRTDRQSDMKKLIVTFRNFTNAPKMVYFIPYFLVDLMFCDANAALWAGK